MDLPRYILVNKISMNSPLLFLLRTLIVDNNRNPVILMKERSRTPATKKIAMERIEILFEQARLEFSRHPERSNRFVGLARRIAMRQRIRIDREFRRQFCHHCYAFLVPGNNVRIRVHRSNVVVTCHRCNKRTRYSLVRPYV